MKARRTGIRPRIYSTAGTKQGRRKLAWSLVSCITVLTAALVPNFNAASEFSTTGVQQVTIGPGLQWVPPNPDTGNSTPVIPHNGDFVVFASLATNLTTGTHSDKSSNTSNVYLRGPGISDTVLVSARPDGAAPERVDGGAAHLTTGCIEPAVSDVASDGSYAIAFTSDANDLLDGDYAPPGEDPLGPAQVYIRIFRRVQDTVTSQTFLVSQAESTTGGLSIQIMGANERSDQPTISRYATGDGSISHRYTICFRSKAGDFLTTNPNPLLTSTIYCLEGIGYTKTEEGDTFYPGIKLGPIAPSPPGSTVPQDALGHSEPQLSRDGQTLAFVSDLQVLTTALPTSTSPLKQVYSLLLSPPFTPTLLSFRTDGQPAYGNSDNPSLSHDGRYVAFIHAPIQSALLGPELSGFPGRVVPFFVRHERDAPSYQQINTTHDGHPSSSVTIAGQLDDSGRYAVFSDRGTNIAPGANGFSQVYFKDLEPSDTSPGGPLLPVSVKQTLEGSFLGTDHSGFGTNNTAHLVAIGSTGTGSFLTAFTSYAPNFAITGNPREAAPYIFRSQVDGSFGDPPTETPTPTHTPTATTTPTPQASPTLTTPAAPPAPAPIVGEPQLLVPNAPIVEPPHIEVQPTNGGKRFNIRIFLQLFRLDPAFGSKSNFLALAARGARLTYAVEIRKAGSRQRITRSSSKNVVTVRKLEPGRYTVRYRVSAKVGKRVIKSRISPPATIALS